MSQEIIAADPDRPGYSTTERAMAGVLLVAAAFLAVICVDVLTDGRITGALAAPAGLPTDGEDQ